jgi:anti-sigma-K factor RskA
MNDHDLIEELASARALGGLDPEDAAVLEAELASHGDCAECRRVVAEAEEVAGRLAFAVDPVPVPAGFEDRVIAATRAEAVVPMPSQRPRRAGPAAVRTWARPLVGAAVAVALFVGGWVASDVLGGTAGDVPAGTRVVTFEGEEPGSLSVAYAPGEPGVYLLGSGLATLTEGEAYELWMLRDGSPVPASCFRPSADGSLFSFVDADVGSADTMAVTIEPSTCSTEPTTSPILTAKIATA